jgi:hypothetical protein
MIHLRLGGLCLLLFPVLGTGCGVAEKVAEKFDPTASVIRVQILETTPEYTRVRVDVKMEDADLLLGFLKLKYNFLLEQVPVAHQNNVERAELAELKKSGLSFVVTIPRKKVESEGNVLRYQIQGAIVVKCVAKIAEVPFQYKSQIALQ